MTVDININRQRQKMKGSWVLNRSLDPFFVRICHVKSVVCARFAAHALSE